MKNLIHKYLNIIYHKLFIILKKTRKNKHKFKKKTKKIIREIEKSGLETRPIVCGNILNQPAINLFKLNKKKTFLKNCQEIEERGFYIGLNTKKNSLKKLKKISEILGNSINRF